MYEYEKIYRKLLEEDELSKQFVGDWEEDRDLFISMQNNIDIIVLSSFNDSYDCYDDDEGDSYLGDFYEGY